MHHKNSSVVLPHNHQRNLAENAQAAEVESSCRAIKPDTALGVNDESKKYIWSGSHIFRLDHGFGRRRKRR